MKPLDFIILLLAYHTARVYWPSDTILKIKAKYLQWQLSRLIEHLNNLSQDLVVQAWTLDPRIAGHRFDINANVDTIHWFRPKFSKIVVVYQLDDEEITIDIPLDMLKRRRSKNENKARRNRTL